MGIPSLAGVCGGPDKAASDRASSVVSGTFTAVGPGKAFSIWGPFDIVLWGSRTTTLATTAGSAAASVGSATGVAAGDAINASNVPPGTTVGAIAGTDVTLAFPPQCWSGQILSAQAVLTNVGDEFGNLPNGKSVSTLVGATLLPNSYFAAGATVLNVGPDGRSLHISSAPTTVPPSPFPVQIWFAPNGHCITETGTETATFTSGATSNYNATVQIERSFDGGATWIPCNVGAGSVASFNSNQVISLSFGEPEAAVIYRLNCLVFSATANVVITYRISTTGQAAVSIPLSVAA